MIRRSSIAVWFFFTAAWGLFFLADVWPSIALALVGIAQGEPPTDGFVITSRQGALLVRTLWMSGAASVACVLFSLPTAYVLGQSARMKERPLLIAMLAALLLCPPMVYAFGWQRLLPAEFNATLRCIGVWALWAWPVPAMLVGAGWSRVGRSVQEAGRLDCGPAMASVRVGLPAVRQHIILAFLVVFIIFFNDYGVPHACGLSLYATELLGWAANSPRVIDSGWPSIPVVAVTVLALWATLRLWRACAADQPANDARQGGPGSASPVLPCVAIGCFAISCALPLAALATKLETPWFFVEAVSTYWRDILWSISLAGLAGLLTAWMGLAAGMSGRLGKTVAVWTVLLGAWPGALVGGSLVAAYNHAAFSWIYDSWPILVLSSVARFGWVGVMAANLVLGTGVSGLLDEARTNGATRTAAVAWIVIPLGLPVLAATAGIVAALSVADVAASTLVRVPFFSPLSHILIEKFHRFEDGMLICLSLLLVLVSAAGAWLVVAVLQRET